MFRKDFAKRHLLKTHRLECSLIEEVVPNEYYVDPMDTLPYIVNFKQRQAEKRKVIVPTPETATLVTERSDCRDEECVLEDGFVVGKIPKTK